MVQKIRFTEIDLLRFVAAVAVMFFHYTFRGFAQGGKSAIGIPSLAWIFKYGYLGVDLFFMISGFVILMTAIDRTAKSFVISRIVRLFPAFWISCTITALVTFFWGGTHFTIKFWEYLVNLTMLQGFVHVRSVDGSYWSLFYEIIFYFLVFILIIFRQIKNIQYYLGFWLIASIVLLRFSLKPFGVLLMPEYSSYFIAGAVFYLIAREKFSAFKMILLLGSYIGALVNAIEAAARNAIFYNTEFDMTVVIVLITAFYFIFFMIVFNKTAVLRLDFFGILGALTYPLYLLHQNIGFMIFNAWHVHVDHLFLFALTMSLMFLLAYFVHVFIEEKYAPLLKRLLEKHLPLF